MRQAALRVLVTLTIAMAGALAGLSPGPAQAELAAFRIDGNAYPRRLFDRRVEFRVNEAGRSIHSMRHPGELRRIQRETLNRTIEERLLAMESRRRGLEITDQQIDAALNDRGAAPWLPPDARREQVEVDLRINALLRQLTQEVRVEPLRVRERMNRESAPSLPERVRASHILLRAPAQIRDEQAWQRLSDQARSLMERATDEKTFSTLAIEHSQDRSAPRGGDLGWFERGRMVPEFEEAAFSGQPGDIIGPVRTAFGVHVLRIQGREASRPLTPTEWQARIESQLQVETLASTIQALIDQLRQNARIEVSFALP